MRFTIELLEQSMASPWLYPGVLLIALIDAFFPVVPSETAVIMAGVFAASGTTNLFGVIAAATGGALAGDHISYLIGRRWGARLLARAAATSRRRAGFEWARRSIAQRGGLILIVARYIPGGRTAVTITMGALNYPIRSFLLFDLLAALSWALYSALVGYFGGLAFERDPLRGVLLGIGFALTVTAATEVIRYVVRRRRARRTDEPVDSPTTGTVEQEVRVG